MLGIHAGEMGATQIETQGTTMAFEWFGSDASSRHLYQRQLGASLAPRGELAAALRSAQPCTGIRPRRGATGTSGRWLPSTFSTARQIPCSRDSLAPDSRVSLAVGRRRPACARRLDLRWPFASATALRLPRLSLHPSRTSVTANRLRHAAHWSGQRTCVEKDQALRVTIGSFFQAL